MDFKQGSWQGLDDRDNSRSRHRVGGRDYLGVLPGSLACVHSWALGRENIADEFRRALAGLLCGLEVRSPPKLQCPGANFPVKALPP